MRGGAAAAAAPATGAAAPAASNVEKNVVCSWILIAIELIRIDI